jgi:predicted oxidoreductase
MEELTCMPPSNILTHDLTGPARLAFGTWRLTQDPRGCEPAHIASLLRLCADLGIRLIDTAEIYGHYEVEALIGAALRLDPGLRQELTFITKCGIYVPCGKQPDVRVSHYNATAEKIIASAESSLRLLGLEQLPLLLVHRPDWLTPAEETARALDSLVASGKIAEFGVSNYTNSQLDTLESFLSKPVSTNQVQFSLLHHTPLFDGTFDRCQTSRMTPMAWSVLGGGKLFTDDDKARNTLSCLQGLGRDYDAEPDEIAYAWALQHPARPVVITGTVNETRLRRAARASELVLAREDWYALWEASAGRRIP